jgi:hypothetical protein
VPGWLSHNPVAWVATLNGAVDLAIAFGVPISDPEKLAIGVFLGLISTLFVQSQVTSTAKLSSLGVTITPVAARQIATVAPVAPVAFQPSVSNSPPTVAVGGVVQLP